MSVRKTLYKSLILASAFLPLIVVAQTQTDTSKTEAEETSKPSPFYVAVSGGVNLQSNQVFEGIQTPAAGVPGMAGAPATVRVSYKSGPVIRAAIGYRWKKGFIKWLKPRTEIELSHSNANVESGSFNGGN